MVSIRIYLLFCLLHELSILYFLTASYISCMPRLGNLFNKPKPILVSVEQILASCSFFSGSAIRQGNLTSQGIACEGRAVAMKLNKSSICDIHSLSLSSQRVM